MKKIFRTHNATETQTLGKKIGGQLRGGEVIEFLSDLGGGKTTFISGLAEGFGSKDPVASPSFTISYTYSRADGKRLHHFDFYRLNEAGIVGAELDEFLGDPESVVAIEWGELVHDILPQSRAKVTLEVVNETTRELTIDVPDNQSYILKGASEG